MSRVLVALAGVVAALGPVAAQDDNRFAPGDAVLSCQASASVTCAYAECVQEADPMGYPVQFRIDLATRRGSLCTFTYCRNFALMSAPAAPAREPGLTGFGEGALTGFTVSAASSSTETEPQPVIDFALSISRDGESFFLGNIDEGGVSGWMGGCELAEPNEAGE